MNGYDLIVVGGGISGVWTAYFAASAGKKVAIVDSSILGSGGTGRCAGIHTTQLALEIDVSLSKRSLEIYDEFADRFECSEMRNKCGFLSIEESWMARESSETLSKHGIPHLLLSSEELREFVPGIIIRDSELGVYTPHDIIIDISLMYQTMRKVLKSLNVDIYEYAVIEKIEKQGRYIQSIKSNNFAEFKAEHYVFAAGPWNKGLLDKLEIWKLPTTIYVCQALILSRPVKINIVPIYFQDSHIYMRPDGDSRLIIGNGYAKIIDNPDICPSRAEPEYIEDLAEKICDRLENLSDIRVIGGWTGPCSTTPDGYPVLGRIPGFDNAYIFDGLNGYGIMRAPAMAELFINALLKNRWNELPSMFDPERFNGLKNYEPKVIELHS